MGKDLLDRRYKWVKTSWMRLKWNYVTGDSRAPMIMKSKNFIFCLSKNMCTLLAKNMCVSFVLLYHLCYNQICTKPPFLYYEIH